MNRLEQPVRNGATAGRYNPVPCAAGIPGRRACAARREFFVPVRPCSGRGFSIGRNRFRLGSAYSGPADRGAGAGEFGKEIVGGARGMRADSPRKAEPVGWRLPRATPKQTYARQLPRATVRRP